MEPNKPAQQPSAPGKQAPQEPHRVAPPPEQGKAPPGDPNDPGTAGDYSR